MSLQAKFYCQFIIVYVWLGPVGGGATVLKCIPGVKLPKDTYSLMHLNTPGFFVSFGIHKKLSKHS